MPRANSIFALLLLFGAGPAFAQTAPQLDRILAQLDRLEQENKALLDEVHALRSEVSALRSQAAGTTPQSAAAIDQKLDIQANRIDELDQTKVGSSQRFPIRLSGMVLFNGFLNSHQSGGADYPTVAAAPGPAHDGATVRQTILGMEFQGPRTVWGGAVHASLYADFFTTATARDQVLRLRTASIGIDWRTRSIMAGLEKPIFNPRDPDSLAQVGVSPLTGTGNLWLWLPQVRVEQDFGFGPSSGLRARMGVVETREVSPYGGTLPSAAVEPDRPGLEGRFDFFHNLDDRRRIEIAPGFHVSTTHAGGASIPSRLVSVDWFLNPWERLELSGAFYSGENVAHLGTGGIRQGYYVEYGVGKAVGSMGGWAQLTLHTLPRLDFHFFSGQEDDRNSDLAAGGIGKNLMLGANLFYRLAPNVLFGVEASQLRSVYIGAGTRRNNHYDVALGYLF
jgi:hypothetical protein